MTLQVKVTNLENVLINKQQLKQMGTRNVK